MHRARRRHHLLAASITHVSDTLYPPLFGVDALRHGASGIGHDVWRQDLVDRDAERRGHVCADIRRWLVLFLIFIIHKYTVSLPTFPE